MTSAPADLDHKARACWLCIQKIVCANGEWEDVDAQFLTVVANQCSIYMDLAREFRALMNLEPAERERIERALEETRMIARNGLAKLKVLPVRQLKLADVDEHGADADIAALCAGNSIPEGGVRVYQFPAPSGALRRPTAGVSDPSDAYRVAPCDPCGHRRYATKPTMVDADGRYVLRYQRRCLECGALLATEVDVP
jgi:hypothetical protein